MKPCPACNYPNPDNLEECFKCGSDLIDDNSAVVDAPPKRNKVLLYVECFVTAAFFVVLLACVLVGKYFPHSLVPNYIGILKVICTILSPTAFGYCVGYIISKAGDLIAGPKAWVHVLTSVLSLFAGPGLWLYILFPMFLKVQSHEVGVAIIILMILGISALIVALTSVIVGTGLLYKRVAPIVTLLAIYANILIVCLIFHVY